ncbi:MAG TPA: imidazole glycerol phosphate synthase subunit HisH [bacterium]|nr:imidazole glycerol phosphate synthase subunit HisH [bacterium]HPO09574.1 imidazole glycerol phosphate synthase subunit HisH [bacterium]HQO34401.1 imidazole glycerol phosphate synthase subunit HisH [bacterium]HQP97093.1 imidazole glycerol phosphate synthase subunit HisH [bacterium]
MILIVDHGLCNVDSVARAIEECGGSPLISEDPAECARAERIILPGVGSFHEASGILHEKGWVSAIRREVLEYGIPLLGICLGMQLLASTGTEGGDAPGLDLIPGSVVRLEPPDKTVRIPHVGWNEVHQNQSSPLFADIPDKKDFYFTHSYHLVPTREEHVLATTPYCGSFVSIVGSGKVFGTQFHPEKSLGGGLRMLKNFLAVC